MGLERGTVELREHTPEWRVRYEREVERLRGALGGRFVEFEHVGSTAIEGMPAKPVVDLLGVVPDLDPDAELVGALVDLGYEHRPDAGTAGRVFFARGPPTERTHYLHVVERGGDSHEELVAFRDHLRANPDVAAEYARLKRDLADRYPDDRDAYTSRKGEFVADVLAEALE